MNYLKSVGTIRLHNFLCVQFTVTNYSTRQGESPTLDNTYSGLNKWQKKLYYSGLKTPSFGN